MLHQQVFVNYDTDYMFCLQYVQIVNIHIICIVFINNALSPKGKAQDFDSCIVGSIPTRVVN